MDKESLLPFISIITPSYNSAQFIEETILSVLKQDYPWFEHIVVDGASSDGTVDILKRYGDHIRWISEPDEGQSDALNKGVHMARGDIIGWLNADDTYERTDVLREVAEAFANYPDSGLVYAHCNLIDDMGRVVGAYRAKPFRFEKLVLGNLIPCITAFWRRDIFNRVGKINTDLHYVMDYELWLRMTRRTCAQHVDATWGNFRVSEGSKTASSPICFLEETLGVYDRFFDDPTLPREISGLRSRAFARTHWLAGLTLYQDGEDVSGVSHCQQAVSDFGLLASDADYALQTLVNRAFKSSGWFYPCGPEADPEGFVRRVLDAIDGLPGVDGDFIRKALGRYYAVQAFVHYEKEGIAELRSLVPKAWFYDPTWMVNLGLTSLWIESIFGTRLTGVIRRLLRRLVLT